jgi:hypothetical protein
VLPYLLQYTVFFEKSLFKQQVLHYHTTYDLIIVSTDMTYNIYDSHPTSRAMPDEALRIAELREELMLDSDDIRLGNDRHPEQTTIRLAQSALLLASSAASMFEKTFVLNTVHANILAAGTKRRNMRTIAGLSHQALRVAYPRAKDRATNRLNRLDISARRRAIRHTAPDTPFIIALEEAWGHSGHPIGPLIETTEEIVLRAYQARVREAREKNLSTDTGVVALYDPFADEDDDTLLNTEEFIRGLKL